MRFTLFNNVSFLATYAISIQNSFTILMKELPYQTAQLMKHVLNQSNLSDIERSPSILRKNAKLLKILLLKGEYGCKELLNTLSLCCNRDDLIETITKKSDEMKKRGSFFIHIYIEHSFIVIYSALLNFKLMN